MDMTDWVQCATEMPWSASDGPTDEISALDTLSDVIHRDLLACLDEFEWGAGIDSSDFELLSMGSFLRVLLLSMLLPSLSDRAACRLASTVPAWRRFVGLAQDSVVDVDVFARIKRRLRHHPAMWTFSKKIITPAQAHYSIRRQHMRTILASVDAGATAPL